MLYDYKAQVVPLVIIINIKEAICTVSISRPLMIYQCEGGSGSTLTSATKLLTGKDDDSVMMMIRAGPQLEYWDDHYGGMFF